MKKIGEGVVNKSRDDLVALLYEWVKSPSMIEHSLAVEQVMRCYAKEYGEDEDLWGLTGLLHDLDFEQFPDFSQHGLKTAEILRSLNADPAMVDAILGHNLQLGVARETRLARCLLASDELVGFVVACAKILPDKNIANLKVTSVVKKFKSSCFARNVDRDEIRLGVKEFDVDFTEHVAFIIKSLMQIAPDVGLAA